MLGCFPGVSHARRSKTWGRHERTALPRGQAAAGSITPLRHPGRNLDNLLSTKPMPVDSIADRLLSPALIAAEVAMPSGNQSTNVRCRVRRLRARPRSLWSKKDNQLSHLISKLLFLNAANIYLVKG